MQFPDDENGDVLRRMQQSGFDFSRPHKIEFFAVYRTEEEADKIALMYVADHKQGEKIKNIATRPHDKGGMELELVIEMLATHNNITAFEKKLDERTKLVKGYLDGWGVLQE